MRAWDFKLSEFLLEFIHFAVVNSFSKETLEVSYTEIIYICYLMQTCLVKIERAYLLYLEELDTEATLYSCSCSL